MTFTKPMCPYCQQPAELVNGLQIYPHRQDLAHLNFWSCMPCDAYVGTHAKGAWLWQDGVKLISDGTLPLGRLADARLRRAKSAAHSFFDPLWKEGMMKRGEAYTWLAQQLGIPKDQCHIGMMDAAQCYRVVEIIKSRRTL